MGFASAWYVRMASTFVSRLKKWFSDAKAIYRSWNQAKHWMSKLWPGVTWPGRQLRELTAKWLHHLLRSDVELRIHQQVLHGVALKKREDRCPSKTIHNKWLKRYWLWICYKHLMSLHNSINCKLHDHFERPMRHKLCHKCDPATFVVVDTPALRSFPGSIDESWHLEITHGFFAFIA